MAKKKQKDRSKSSKVELTEKQLDEAAGGAESSADGNRTRVSQIKNKVILPTRDILSEKF